LTVKLKEVPANYCICWLAVAMWNH